MKPWIFVKSLKYTCPPYCPPQYPDLIQRFVYSATRQARNAEWLSELEHLLETISRNSFICYYNFTPVIKNTPRKAAITFKMTLKIWNNGRSLQQSIVLNSRYFRGGGFLTVMLLSLSVYYYLEVSRERLSVSKRENGFAVDRCNRKKLNSLRG
jgi:hypothetical protein